MKRRIMFFALLLFAVVLTACGGGAAGLVEVTNVWGRNSPAAAENGAFYMNITNNTDQEDQLTGATAAAACGTVELHEMYMKDDGAMGMRPVTGGSIPLPVGQKVELKVGGLHVMCLGKLQEFNVGDKIEVTLQFANAEDMTVTAEIREEAPEGMDN